MNIDELKSVANAIVAKQKGVLAADESSPTIKKRFDSIELESTEENRRRYREICSPPRALNAHSAASSSSTKPCVRARATASHFRSCWRAGDDPRHQGRQRHQGVGAASRQQGDRGTGRLARRLAEYRQLGAQFAKWRAVIEIDERDVPSPFGIHANAHALARYAALCQEAGLVPIVEPEVLMDGAHGIERCEVVTAQVLQGCSPNSTPMACASRACCSSRTWLSPA